eukprot:CAMPEP_0180658446 /NCGR_PEP_ID=MMETSP1037_2-20121125/57005_1 /TAXON_ID=632150 /ORGANISM="Azadinium spinosum, Strain 3D9" /LENGTH=125 /DNA_ID=CAMNT_0022685327 /DNA_START=8 /DNA_END=385 /DNA_ORIENTATION=+
MQGSQRTLQSESMWLRFERGLSCSSCGSVFSPSDSGNDGDEGPPISSNVRSTYVKSASSSDMPLKTGSICDCDPASRGSCCNHGKESDVDCLYNSEGSGPETAWSGMMGWTLLLFLSGTFSTDAS